MALYDIVISLSDKISSFPDTSFDIPNFSPIKKNILSSPCVYAYIFPPPNNIVTHAAVAIVVFIAVGIFFF